MNRFEDVHRKAWSREIQRTVDAILSNRPRFYRPPPQLTASLSSSIALEWLALQRYAGDWEHAKGPFALPPTSDEYQEEYRKLLEGEGRETEDR